MILQSSASWLKMRRRKEKLYNSNIQLNNPIKLFDIKKEGNVVATKVYGIDLGGALGWKLVGFQCFAFIWDLSFFLTFLVSFFTSKSEANKIKNITTLHRRSGFKEEAWARVKLVVTELSMSHRLWRSIVTLPWRASYTTTWSISLRSNWLLNVWIWIELSMLYVLCQWRSTRAC